MSRAPCARGLPVGRCQSSGGLDTYAVANPPLHPLGASDRLSLAARVGLGGQRNPHPPVGCRLRSSGQTPAPLGRFGGKPVICASNPPNSAGSSPAPLPPDRPLALFVPIRFIKRQSTVANPGGAVERSRQGAAPVEPVLSRTYAD